MQRHGGAPSRVSIVSRLLKDVPPHLGGQGEGVREGLRVRVRARRQAKAEESGQATLLERRSEQAGTQ